MRFVFLLVKLARRTQNNRFDIAAAGKQEQRPVKSGSADDAAGLIEANPDYRLLRRVPGPGQWPLAIASGETRRGVFVDTETTGLDPRLGHRIIEIACVEAIGRDVSGRTVHHYLDPEREIDAGATAVHGLSWDDLRGKSKFAAVVDELLAFLSGATVVIHNAPFDVSFLDQELARLRKPPVAGRDFSVVDSLALAKATYPGKRNSLDALCDRLGIDNSHRNLHGALLDARLLAEAYFAMTRGQGTLDMSVPAVAADLSGEADAMANGVPHSIAVVALPEGVDVVHSEYMARLAKQSGVERDWH